MFTKKRKDPFNQALESYETFINTLYTTVNANAVAWDIDPLVVAAFLAVLTPFNTAYGVSKNKNSATATDRATTQGARGVVNKFARPFVQKWIFLNEKMDDADIVECGLEPKDRTKTPVGIPSTQPDMYLRPSTSHNIVASFRQPKGSPASSKRGKPPGVKSIRVAYFIGPNPPAEPGDYTKFISFSNTTGVIAFNAAEAGKPVTLASCWVNEKEEQGDWCEIQTINIP